MPNPTEDNVVELAPHQPHDAGTRIYLNQLREILGGKTREEYLAARFAHDDCRICGRGASGHQVRLDRYDDAPIVECVDARGYIR